MFIYLFIVYIYIYMYVCLGFVRVAGNPPAFFQLATRLAGFQCADPDSVRACFLSRSCLGPSCALPSPGNSRECKRGRCKRGPDILRSDSNPVMISRPTNVHTNHALANIRSVGSASARKTTATPRRVLSRKVRPELTPPEPTRALPQTRPATCEQSEQDMTRLDP